MNFKNLKKEIKYQNLKKIQDKNKVTSQAR